MHEIFVNYRTGDEESAAAMIAYELTRRFGPDSIFFASTSIPAGRRFPAELVKAAEECEALLAVIGPRWAEVRGADGRPALEAEQDWTRHEIRTALDRGVLVIPVLVGKATRIDRAVLPEDLLELADCQYKRFDHRNAQPDLKALGDTLARLLPDLGRADRDARCGTSRRRPVTAKSRPEGPATPGCRRATSNSVSAAVSGTSTETCPAPSSTSRRGR